MSKQKGLPKEPKVKQIKAILAQGESIGKV